MKQIFTSLMLLAASAFGAAAANFTVSGPDGRSYSDGDVITVGYTFDGFAYAWQPDLKVTVNENASMFGNSTFTVTVGASQPGVVQFCGVGGSCTIVGSAPVTRSNTYAKGQEFALGVEILDSPDILAEEVSTTVKITDSQETVNLTVKFIPTEAAGISAPEASATEVSFSGRTMHFSLDAATKFSLYNISGRTLVDRTLSGSGSLNLGGIPAGVYVYRLGTLTGKVLLK